MSQVLQERLNGLSAAINALLLVNPEYAWIDSLLEGNSDRNESYPSKKAKKLVKDQGTCYNQKLGLFVQAFFILYL